jgi:hypothetical protein
MPAVSDVVQTSTIAGSVVAQSNTFTSMLNSSQSAVLVYALNRTTTQLGTMSIAMQSARLAQPCNMVYWDVPCTPEVSLLSSMRVVHRGR